MCQKCKRNYIFKFLSCIIHSIKITCFYRKKCICEECVSGVAKVPFLYNAMKNGNDKPLYLFLTLHFSFRYTSFLRWVILFLDMPEIVVSFKIMNLGLVLNLSQINRKRKWHDKCININKGKIQKIFSKWCITKYSYIYK